ncbi:MAG: hypothetical protein ACSHW7_11120 [Patiriisocius sp.]|uniref:hypothetical protein n=1 Tax=Patiriisocius sp. TaxID=2822396 RepID=UPI003EF8CD0A
MAFIGSNSFVIAICWEPLAYVLSGLHCFICGRLGRRVNVDFRIDLVSEIPSINNPFAFWSFYLWIHQKHTKENLKGEILRFILMIGTVFF